MGVGLCPTLFLALDEPFSYENGSNLPLYHTFQILSIGNFNKNLVLWIPNLCAIFRLAKNKKICYNKREVKGKRNFYFKKFLKKIKKSLDFLKKKCYNKYIEKKKKAS